MNDLIESLHLALNDKNEDDYSKLTGNIDKEILDIYNISYENVSEGVEIDLINQTEVIIFKTKEDFYAHSSELDFRKNIIIIQDKLLFEPGKDADFIFINVLYSFKFFNFFKDKLSSHHDLSRKQLIFLSEQSGKNIIGYKSEHETDLTQDLQLKKHYENITNNNADFLNFLKNSIISYVELIEPEKRYITALKNLAVIHENAKRDFDLYQSKFSFTEFKKGLEVEEIKYIQDVHNLVSDFSSKLYMPIEFGVYILLVTKFSDNFYPLIASMIIIISWSAFRLWSNMQSLNNANDLKDSITSAFDVIQERSGQDTKNSKVKIKNAIDKMISEIKAYMAVTLIFSISVICIALTSLFIVK